MVNTIQYTKFISHTVVDCEVESEVQAVIRRPKVWWWQQQLHCVSKLQLNMVNWQQKT